MESLAVITPCRRGEVIYARGDAAEHWYRVVSGLARKLSLGPDGRRQIIDFLLPGDLFGFNARDKHPLTVEAAVAGTVVARYPRRRAEALANADPQVGRYVRLMVLQALSRLQARALIIERATAVDKVRSFLLEMAERPASAMSDALILPLSRQDIADYLGLSAETVGRALAQLRQTGAITLAPGQGVLITRRSTSGQDDGPQS